MDVSVGDTIGAYRLEESLGDGDVVQVFKAVSQTDGQRVALKLVRPDIDDEEVIRRFQRETRIAQRVQHPHLVRVVETGEAGGVPFMATQYVAGRTVSRLIDERGPLEVDAVVRLIGEVGAALDALHRVGIMHRDVRSSNVLVDETGAAALTDFGFARSQTDSRITELHRPIGTLDYRAPELFLGKSAERASDIYSLGCVAYECLVGIPPFGELSDLIELGRAHIAEPPPSPSTRRPDAPPQFADGVLTALAKDPARRPPSGAAYAKLLRFGLSTAS